MLMRAGGVPMWIVLLFGLVTLGAAVYLAWKPTASKVAFVRSMTAATGFAVLSGMAAAVGAVMTRVPANPEWAASPDLHLIVMTGLGESMSAPILGCAMLAVAWALTATGVRRLA